MRSLSLLGTEDPDGVAALVLEAVSKRLPTLVFCPTRRSAEQCARLAARLVTAALASDAAALASDAAGASHAAGEADAQGHGASEVERSARLGLLSSLRGSPAGLQPIFAEVLFLLLLLYYS